MWRYRAFVNLDNSLNLEEWNYLPDKLENSASWFWDSVRRVISFAHRANIIGESVLTVTDHNSSFTETVQHILWDDWRESDAEVLCVCTTVWLCSTDKHRSTDRDITFKRKKTKVSVLQNCTWMRKRAWRRRLKSMSAMILLTLGNDCALHPDTSNARSAISCNRE